ncbi:MAG TPA: nuclear transport factor 2 family protein [Gemmatimonadales bacterium]|nr:nuclear transport factor 2 family protein [Gemmatimonadales bacterium]
MRLLAPPMVVLAAACHSAASTPKTTPAAVPARSELLQVMTRQLERSAADWNRGDLDAFVADYARDTSTTFVDHGRAQHGFDFIRSRYAPRFAPGAQRDSLRFEAVEARPLGARHALVTARFILYRGGRTTASGPFTLVLENRPDGWKIIHDHSSGD